MEMQGRELGTMNNRDGTDMNNENTSLYTETYCDTTKERVTATEGGTVTDTVVEQQRERLYGRQ